MKRVVIALLVVFLVTSLVGCDTNQSVTNEIDELSRLTLAFWSANDLAANYDLRGFVVEDSLCLRPHESFTSIAQTLFVLDIFNSTLNNSIEDSKSMHPQVSFEYTAQTLLALDVLNSALYNSSLDLSEMTREFNQRNETDFQLAFPISVTDIYASFPLFTFVHERLLLRNYIMREWESRSESERELKASARREWTSEERWRFRQVADELENLSNEIRNQLVR
jgi:hypothetical protein